MRTIYTFMHQLYLDLEVNYPQRMHFTLAIIILLMLTNILQCFWQFQDNVHSIYYCILSSKTILGYLDIDIVAIIIIISSA